MNDAFSVISFLLFVPLQEEISYNSLLPHSLSSSFSFPLFLSSHHIYSSPATTLSSLRYIGNLAHINITKLKRILRQIVISHKYFIHNDLLI